MIRIMGCLVLLAAVSGLAAEADAAWNPSTSSYTLAISNARTALSGYWGANAPAAMPARAQKALRKADGKFAKAQSALGRNPGWKEIQLSMKFMAKGMAYVEKAARKASTLAAFQTVVYGTGGVGPSLYGAANAMALSASSYVNRNFTSRKSTKKMLIAGGHLARAARLAGKTPPKYARAIGQCRDAVRVLRRFL